MKFLGTFNALDRAIDVVPPITIDGDETSVWLVATSTTAVNNLAIPTRWLGKYVTFQVEGADGEDVYILFSSTTSCTVIAAANNGSTPQNLGWRLFAGKEKDYVIDKAIKSMAYVAASGTPGLRAQVSSR